MLINILLVVHLIAAIGIIVLVLLQQGKGADMGAAFGGGSQSVFGARGSANFLSRTTALLAAIFFFASLSLAYLYGQQGVQTSITDSIQPQVEAEVSDQSQSVDASTELPDVPNQDTEQSAGQSNDGANNEVPDAPSEDNTQQ